MNLIKSHLAKQLDMHGAESSNGILDVSIQLIESIGKLVLRQLVGVIANSRHVLHHETNESFHIVFNYTTIPLNF
jgi:hypothetical protein